MEKARPGGIDGRRFVIVGGIVIALCLTAVLSSFFFCGRKRFVEGSVIAEGHTLVATLGAGLVQCAKDGGLPVTTSPVPMKLALVSGKTYASGEHDWDDPAFECAQFANHAPQHFQIQWERQRPDHGRVRASADTDGDGMVDLVVFAEIYCDPEDLRSCTLGPVTP